MNAPVLGWWTWTAMLLVLAAAAVLSFAALRDLAVLCGTDARLAWLLPLAVDAGAAVSTKVWLDGQASTRAESFARSMTVCLLATTVAANALHSGLVAAAVTPAWWVAVTVGAVPPAVVGAVMHLAVLVGRTDARAEGTQPASFELTAVDDEFDEHGLSRRWDQAPPVTAQDRSADLIAAGVGRRRLARELNISEHAARELLDARRNGQEAPE